ncbi:TPA: hypothetical protein RJX14_001144 [Legionella pneumophila]|nr:hypothetical protein [Legionella pneumophila]
MSSATFLVPQFMPLVINNPHGNIQRITSDFSSVSAASDDLSEIHRIIQEMESQSVATTLQTSKFQQINDLLKKKEVYIQQRNLIIDNPLKRLIPFYKQKLQRIDSEIDKLDLSLYELEMEDKINESKINEIIRSAEKRLEEQSKSLERALQKKQTYSMRTNW